MNSPRASHALTGPSRALDPRVNAVRGDLADISLAGQHFSPHYAVPVLRICLRDYTAMLASPGGTQSSELLVGEAFMLLDTSGGWSWGYSAHDHYVGYVEADAIGIGTPAPGSMAGDAIATARRFLGMPYLWGGRGGAGIDCSGLVQRALASIGIRAPRDSDMQRDALGTAVAADAARAGDLVFFPGHVGMMVDDATIIHATRHHGRVVEEPLGTVTTRIAAKRGEGVIAVKRPMP